MHNPFAEKIEENESDIGYIERALDGDAAALESLVLRHQSWIFNIALNMTGDIQHAEDVTQEILIKMISKLSSYDPQKAAFRTWLYRIVANHVINMKESRKEKFFAAHAVDFDFNKYFDNLPDTKNPSSAGKKETAEETKNYCVLCILLCLTRMERLVLVLGAIFDVTDRVGAEICEISRDNFRKILSRSRRKVFQYFKENCSLVNDRNRCKCSELAPRLIKLGVIGKGSLIAGQNSLGTIRSMLGNTVATIENEYRIFFDLYQEQPFLQGPDMVSWLRDLISRSNLQKIFNETPILKM
ncbi:MAG: RNA polymerase sigma factor [Deltaproteobacteria bacterium]|nr:RNA polymerase sigma factor [Deltaproteobacteria bacterium]